MMTTKDFNKARQPSEHRQRLRPPSTFARCHFFSFSTPDLSLTFSFSSSSPRNHHHRHQQEPGSPCRNFVAQIREQQKGIAESTCANPVTVSTKPTAQCCELALTFTPCKCDDDVARVSGRMLAIATYRATQFACQGKCVEPQSVGCKGK